MYIKGTDDNGRTVIIPSHLVGLVEQAELPDFDGGIYINLESNLVKLNGVFLKTNIDTFYTGLTEIISEGFPLDITLPAVAEVKTHKLNVLNMKRPKDAVPTSKD